MTFDITAPLERQFTRDGCKVLAIFDSGLDCKFPIVAWYKYEENSNIYSHSVMLHGNACTDSVNHPSDIITRPEPLPIMTRYANVYSHSLGVPNTNKLMEGMPYAIAIMKITFDPNTGISTAETVWKKEKS